MRFNYKDIIILSLVFILIILLILRYFDFENQLQDRGNYYVLTCSSNDVKDIYNRYILYNNGTLFFNGEHTCDLISTSIKEFSKKNKNYVYSTSHSLYKIKDKKLEISVDNDLSQYQTAYSHILEDYDKFINMDKQGYVLKDNVIYYYNSIYLVYSTTYRFYLAYNDNENLKEVITSDSLDSDIVDIFYDYDTISKKYILIIKTKKSYYKKILDYYSMSDEYKTTTLNKDSIFSKNYQNIKFINSEYLIYKNKVWTW